MALLWTSTTCSLPKTAILAKYVKCVNHNTARCSVWPPGGNAVLNEVNSEWHQSTIRTRTSHLLLPTCSQPALKNVACGTVSSKR
jgi:hypothetical protein